MTHIDFYTIEFYNTFAKDSAITNETFKKHHTVPFNEFSCYKENKTSSLWILCIDNIPYRRVIGKSIKILSERDLRGKQDDNK